LDGEEIIVEEVDGVPQCKAATLSKLIEWILKYSNDPFDTEVLIASYELFVSSMTFFHILVLHFPDPAKRSETPDQQDPQQITSDAMVTEKFCGLLKMWIKKELFADFLKNSNSKSGNRLYEVLIDFVNKLATKGLEKQANDLKLEIIRAKRQGEIDSKLKGSLPDFEIPSLPFRTTRDRATSVDFLDPYSHRSRLLSVFATFEPMQVADELTLIEFRMFKEIHEREFMNLNWKKKGSKAGNIKKMVQRANNVSFWVGSMVLSCVDIRNRVAILKRFIIIAQRCRNIRNFNSLMEILGGLNLHPVSRLKNTWGMLPTKYKTIFKKLSKTMSVSQNYTKYRVILNEPKEEECYGTLPYIGVYLRDLVGIEESSNTILETGLINFEKLRRLSKIIKRIKNFQSEEYNLPRGENSEMLENYLKQIEGDSEDKLDELSFMCEPNNKEILKRSFELGEFRETDGDYPEFLRTQF